MNGWSEVPEMLAFVVGGFVLILLVAAAVRWGWQKFYGDVDRRDNRHRRRKHLRSVR